jgi:hypothetical protein
MKKLLWMTIFIVSGVYVLSLHPLSGFAGGGVYFFTGWAIPTLINILLTCVLVFYYTGNLGLVYKLLLLVPLSFILGLNVKILDLGPSSCVIESVSVFKPLHISPSPDKIMHVYMHKAGNLELKSSPFKDCRINGNEGCCCWYFELPNSLLSNNNYFWKLAELIDHPYGRLYSNFKQTDIIDYYIYTEVRSKGKKVFVGTTLKDKEGGHVVINSVYPKSLVFINVFRGIDYEETLSSPHFWKYAFIVLTNNNVWQWIFEEYLEHAKDPITTLLESKEYPPSMFLNSQLDSLKVD